MLTKENFAQLLENKDRTNIKDILKNHQFESNQIDYKETFPDDGKLSKHILGMANSGGGLIIIGVEEDKHNKALSPKGIKTEDIKDTTSLERKIRKYIPNSLKISIETYKYDSSEYGALNGKTFQVIFINCNENEIPYISIKKGNDIDDNQIYIRRNTSTEIVNHDELQKIISKRIKAEEKTDLEKHLNYLKSLHKHTPCELFKNIYINSPLYNSKFNNFIKECITKTEANIKNILNIK